MLIITASHDDRVSPAHSYKFAATLQSRQLAKKPVLLHVESDAGHSGKKVSWRGLDELSFFCDALGVAPENYRATASHTKRVATAQIRAEKKLS